MKDTKKPEEAGPAPVPVKLTNPAVLAALKRAADSLAGNEPPVHGCLIVFVGPGNVRYYTAVGTNGRTADAMGLLGGVEIVKQILVSGLLTPPAPLPS